MAGFVNKKAEGRDFEDNRAGESNFIWDTNTIHGRLTKQSSLEIYAMQ